MSQLLPFLMYPGGKRKLLPKLEKMFPDFVRYQEDFNYAEPFLGGGSVYMHIKQNYHPAMCYINDKNIPLYYTWIGVRDYVHDVCFELKKFKQKLMERDSKEEKKKFYYEFRDEFNKYMKQFMDDSYPCCEREYVIQIAARLIFLNKTGFNGVFRTNSRGEYNTTAGTMDSVSFNFDNMINLSKSLLNHKTMIFNHDYSYFMNVIKVDGSNWFVFLDPPYHETDNSYTNGAFSKVDQECVKECCDRLNNNNIPFMLTNSNTDFIKDLYKEYNIIEIPYKYTIGSKNPKDVKEIIVRNYGD